MSDTPWPHFSRRELVCPCGCERMEMDAQFLGKMEALRYFFGKPLQIVSGFRCPMYNAQSSITGLSGPHITGQAVDILIFGAEAHHLITLAVQLGFSGIGLNQKGPHHSRHLHLDTIENSPGRPRPTIWTY